MKTLSSFSKCAGPVRLLAEGDEEKNKGKKSVSKINGPGNEKIAEGARISSLVSFGNERDQTLNKIEKKKNNQTMNCKQKETKVNETCPHLTPEFCYVLSSFTYYRPGHLEPNKRIIV